MNHPIPGYFAAATLLLTAWVSTGVASESLTGAWIGNLRIPEGPELRVGLEFFERADGSQWANVSSPDQGARYMPVEQLDFDNDGFAARILGVPVVISGRLTDTDQLEGQFRQGDSSFSLTFRRVAAVPEIVRPQIAGLAQVTEEEVRIHNPEDNVWLSATLTLPGAAGEDSPAPAVLLLAGSGPADRDAYHSGHRPLKVLAHALTESGFATLRADKRGVLKSSGEFDALALQDFADDAAAALRFLQGRADVDAERLGIIGHSEGSLVAAMVVSQIPDLKFIVSLSGPGQPAMEVLIDQDGRELLAAGASPREAEILRAFARRYYRAAQDAGSESERRLALQSMYDALEGEDARVVSQGSRGTLGVEFASRDSFARFLRSDPREAWRQVTEPAVLLIAGGKDVQVQAEKNLGAMEDALGKGGNPGVTVRTFPQVNHMMQTAATGGLEEYGQIEESFAPGVAACIAEWLQRQSGIQPSGTMRSDCTRPEG
ncbi:MAG: alpha/beta fold hydrolase [Xanthomonadales bacterium]|nr:alpha/beta fold hydrolase [Xanthomonadales bacterium]